MSLRELKSRRSSAGTGITVLSAMITSLVLILLISREPAQAAYNFFIVPLTNRYFLGNMLDMALLLVLTGLGVTFAFRISLFNLGGEGQVYAGGLVCSLFLLNTVAINSISAVFLALMAALVTGALIAGLSGYLRCQWNVNEIISTFLVSNIIIYVTDHLIATILQDPNSNLVSSKPIPAEYWLLKILPPSNLNISIIPVIILTVATSWVLFRSRMGYEMRMTGLNSQFARYGGIPVKKYFLVSMLISGAFHGLAGAIAIVGSQHRLIKGASSGIGWSGIAVALIARNNPMAILPAALFFSYIELGAQAAMINADFTIESTMVVQALVFFLITSKVINHE